MILYSSIYPTSSHHRNRSPTNRFCRPITTCPDCNSTSKVWPDIDHYSDPTTAPASASTFSVSSSVIILRESEGRLSHNQITDPLSNTDVKARIRVTATVWGHRFTAAADSRQRGSWHRQIVIHPVSPPLDSRRSSIFSDLACLA